MTKNELVILRAGNSISLLPGFHAEKAANFTAQIMDCEMPAAAFIEPINTALVNGEMVDETTRISLKTSPNPFQTSTNIQFNLPTATTVNLAVYDVNGQLVKNIIQRAFFEVGQYQYTFEKDHHASNIYFLVLQTAETQVVQKLMLIR